MVPHMNCGIDLCIDIPSMAEVIDRWRRKWSVPLVVGLLWPCDAM